MTPLAAPPAAPPAVLYDIDWRTYTRLLRVFASRRGYRLTYDRGTLEIMAPLWEHEAPASMLGSFIEALTEELRMPRRVGRCLTLRRRRKQRGLEPDNCYWIANAPHFQGRMHLDLRVDPPPDLAVEVDVTISSLDRMGIYAALGVPEVWRLSHGALTFHELRSRAYHVRPDSLSFPGLTPGDLMGFLTQLGQTDEAVLARRFREWVRRKWPNPPTAPPSP
jgi:Uma2 family endonuclease